VAEPVGFSDPVASSFCQQPECVKLNKRYVTLASGRGVYWDAPTIDFDGSLVSQRLVRSGLTIEMQVLTDLLAGLLGNGIVVEINMLVLDGSLCATLS